MKRKRNVGLPPGAIKYTGSIKGVDVIVDYVEYNSDEIRSESSSGRKTFLLHASNVDKVQWYDIRGLHDENIIRQIADRFDMHPIAIEDAVDIHQRPTYVEYENGHFVSLKVLRYDKDQKRINREALALYFGDGFILSFQQQQTDTLVSVRNRLLNSKGRIRNKKVDYLAYSIVDFVVDNYFVAMDDFEEELELLEDSIIENPQEIDKSKIYELKKELLKIRKSVAPLREAINLLSRSDSPLIEDSTNTFVRDVYDHTIHIIDSADSMRDILSGLHDLYISEISLKMNKIMQFLTIVTALFVPLSFLTGLYGMNFVNIPELKYSNGYFVLWGFMILAVLAMLYYFKRNKWL